MSAVQSVTCVVLWHDQGLYQLGKQAPFLQHNGPWDGEAGSGWPKSC